MKITGDHTGEHRNSAQSESAWKRFRERFDDVMLYEKFTMHTRPGMLKEGQESLNARFSPAVGNPTYYVNRIQCPKLDEDLRMLKRKDDGTQNDEQGKRGHWTDTGRYLCVNYDRLKYENRLRN